MTVLGATCLRNEAPYIVDWLAHHLAFGFDHFVFCTHDCDDGSTELLDALAATGHVTHLPFQPSGDKTVQWQALKIINKHKLTKSFEYALFFDVDEYLNAPEPANSVQDIIAASDGADGIAIPWRFYGSAQIEHYKDAPVTQRFTRAAPRDLHYPLAHLFKSLVRPSAFRQLGVHRPRHKKDTQPRWALAGGPPLPPQLAGNDKAITLYGFSPSTGPKTPVLNHYSLRSAEEFMLKRDRGLPNHADRVLGADYWAERNWNTQEDTSVSRMSQSVADKRSELMDIKGVRAAHETGVMWHKNKIKKLRQNVDNVRFLWRLGLLTGSTEPTAERAKAYLHAQMEAMSAHG
ncbi:MAG: glycosyltransferase family 2 protein [Pseudomonadota bacterium]